MFPVSNHSYYETSTNTVNSSIPRTAVLVCETRIPNPDSIDTYSTFRKEMEKEWEFIIKLGSKRNYHSKKVQTDIPKIETKKPTSLTSDTTVEIKTSADYSYSEEAENFYELGLKCCDVKDKTPHFHQAAQFFRKSANLGHDRAQFNLGRMSGIAKPLNKVFMKLLIN